MEPMMISPMVAPRGDSQGAPKSLRRGTCICCASVAGIVLLLGLWVGYIAATLQEPSCPKPGDNPRTIPPVDPKPTFSYATCMEYYGDSDQSASAEWCRGGSYFTFKSGAGKNLETTGGAGVQIWWRCDGDSSNPQVLFVHGYPTSSWDTWAPASKLLQDTHYVCHLDHQGFGFSDKPRAPYFYSMYEHAAALSQFATSVAGLTNFTLVTHDMGNSVGFAFLQKFYNAATRIVNSTFMVNHHILTNGNVWLPMASLKIGQLALLDNFTGPFISRNYMSSEEMARSSAERMFIPPLSHEDMEMMAGVSGYQEGAKIQTDLIQYLQQRACYEKDWLQALNDSQIPATMVWGDQDPVAPLAVADYVWENVLSKRPAAADYIKVGKAGHYVPHDQPRLFACLVRSPSAASACLSECKDGDCTLAEKS